MSDLGYEKLLAEHNKDYKDVEAFGGNWMPDVAKGYVVLLTKSKRTEFTKDDVGHIQWRITGHIENVADVDQHGKDFCVGRFMTTVPGFIKSAAQVLNNGFVTNDMSQDGPILDDCAGKLVYVDITTSKGKDDKTYINAYMTGLIATEEVIDEPIDPPQGDGGGS